MSYIQFRISEQMGKRFAGLSGDWNLLHCSEEFARKSMYRQRVVHGMLPIAFVSLLDIFFDKGIKFEIIGLSAQFLEPVFLDDFLSLQGEKQHTADDSKLLNIKFSIRKAGSNVTVTKGNLVCRVQTTVEDSSGRAPSGFRVGNESILTDRITMKELSLAEIASGDTDGFNFLVSEESGREFMDILLSGVESGLEKEKFLRSSCLYLPNLLALMLLSTSVGMDIPGKFSAFLGFEAKISKTIKFESPYRFAGEVAHISRSTGIIKKNIRVYDDHSAEDCYVDGSVHVLVNPVSAAMPGISEIAATGVDLGLKHKVVLVTGSSRGLGETMAKLFGLHGSRVVVNYFRGEQDAGRVAGEIQAAGGQAFAAGADVSDSRQVEEMVKRVVEAYGTVDILVNNAVKDFKSIDFMKLAWEDVQDAIDVVVKGAFNCCKAVIPLMLKQGAGKIINMGTLATENPPSNQLKYVVAKSGLVGLTRSLAVELASKNIQVNMVAPSFVETDLVAHIAGGYREKIALDTPMRRNASPIDVAQTVVFLASSYASFMAGQKIMVTGGSAPYL